MDPVQYYVTTLTNAAQKLGPVVLYLVGGYLLFIKLPFFLYYKTLQKPKASSQEDFKPDLDFQKRMEEERVKEFNERMKNLGGGKKKPEAENTQSSQHEEKKHRHQHQSKARGEAKPDQKQKSGMRQATPEEILFKLKPGEVFTEKELKKRYHELLKQNHPDKFRTDHQKEFAEAKTKSINDAYQKLKKNVS